VLKQDGELECGLKEQLGEGRFREHLNRFTGAREFGNNNSSREEISESLNLGFSTRRTVQSNSNGLGFSTRTNSNAHFGQNAIRFGQNLKAISRATISRATGEATAEGNQSRKCVSNYTQVEQKTIKPKLKRGRPGRRHGDIKEQVNKLQEYAAELMRLTQEQEGKEPRKATGAGTAEAKKYLTFSKGKQSKDLEEARGVIDPETQQSILRLRNVISARLDRVAVRIREHFGGHDSVSREFRELVEQELEELGGVKACREKKEKEELGVIKHCRENKFPSRESIPSVPLLKEALRKKIGLKESYHVVSAKRKYRMLNKHDIHDPVLHAKLKEKARKTWAQQTAKLEKSRAQRADLLGRLRKAEAETRRISSELRKTVREAGMMLTAKSEEVRETRAWSQVRGHGDIGRKKSVKYLTKAKPNVLAAQVSKAKPKAKQNALETRETQKTLKKYKTLETRLEKQLKESQGNVKCLEKGVTQARNRGNATKTRMEKTRKTWMSLGCKLEELSGVQEGNRVQEESGIREESGVQEGSEDEEGDEDSQDSRSDEDSESDDDARFQSEEGAHDE
jgi:hypothetical protein